MTKTVCDMCGKDIGARGYNVSITPKDDALTPLFYALRLERDYDICPECAQKITEFIKGEKVGE